MTKLYWTLVQHAGFVFGNKPEFRYAVEELAIEAKEVAIAAKTGAEIFSTYADARDTAFNENYPPGHSGLVPKAAGKFSSTKLSELLLYLRPKA